MHLCTAGLFVWKHCSSPTPHGIRLTARAPFREKVSCLNVESSRAR